MLSPFSDDYPLRDYGYSNEDERLCLYYRLNNDGEGSIVFTVEDLKYKKEQEDE